MATRNVTLPERLNVFVDSSVAEGRFIDVDETVRAALELLQREQADYVTKADWLRRAAQQGIDQIERGEGTHYDSIGQLLQEIHTIAEEVRAETDVRAHE